MSSGRRGIARCQMGPGADGSLGGATEGRYSRGLGRGCGACTLLGRGRAGTSQDSTPEASDSRQPTAGQQDSRCRPRWKLMLASASVTPPIRIPKVKGERPGQFSLSVEASDPATG